ncbi:gamma-glutamylcyclotransferase [Reyranella sp.]|uniref:gamma-glutamylcyclotransferase n=1 Tax=Reyranella sp. TaxID=1929291 RepID=UPI0025DFB074|nr:gamma-glutamylcyclotransferase [Reyranella sp.]
MKWYFAYGSNMDARRLFDDRMKSKGIVWGERIGGRLDGWRLTFDKLVTRAGAPPGAGAGNIVTASGEAVHGTLNLLPPAGFDELDVHEGVAGGHYERRTVPVVRADNGEAVEAIAYVALKVAAGLRPTRAYLACLLAGRDLLPADYWERLGATPTVD